VSRIRINYIKHGHEGVQLLIEYYNAILVASTRKIYTKSTFIVPHRPYSALLLHCGTFTQCLESWPNVFIYRKFWAVLNATFGAQPRAALSAWAHSFVAQPCTALSVEPILSRLNHAPP